MEQHPIPQNVSSYQFKLVGDMTLKQFFQLAGGILVGIIFYSSPLLTIIKYPLALFSVLLGIGLAFLPLEERPLEKWIFAFFRAIYSPTVFGWVRGSHRGRLFQDEAPDPNAASQDAALKDYLSKTGTAPTASGNLEQAESGFLSKLSGMLSSVSAPPTKPQTPVQPSPQPEFSSAPPTTLQPVPSLAPTPSLAPSLPQAFFVNDPNAIQQRPAQQPQQAREIKIPEQAQIKIPQAAQKVVIEEHTVPQASAVQTNVQAPLAGNEMVSTTRAMFSIDAAPPSPPTYPNVVVGQVVDQDRRIIEGAIMEIRDSAGRPIRALRSNRAGHFITVTQLDNGHYEIITEKDGFEFTPVNFDATGTIIPPILVQGKRLGPPAEEIPSVPVKPAYSIN